MQDICKVNAMEVKVTVKEDIPRLVNGLREKLDAEEKTIVCSDRKDASGNQNRN